MTNELLWNTPVNVFPICPREMTAQSGIMDGADPSQYSSADPLRLWTIQLGVIMIMAQFLTSILKRFKQPRIIAHILGGILLGPSVLGRIPGFTDHIFPAVSIPCLILTAKIGLCLFLFIIGLELDWTIVRRNVRSSVMVSLGGILLSWNIGCGVSVAIYHNFSGSDTDFNYLMLFIAMSYSVTALPVLCRILSILKLRDTTVGGIVLSAAVANDAISWSLLALVVAFVNATSNVTALWTFLICVGYILFLLFPTKWALLRLARKTRSTVRGPTMFYMTVVMVVLWGSALFIDIVGVNAIFGAFVVGIIVPREGGISVAFVERLEDIVEIMFLPLYFTISGLNTNLGLINSRAAWGFLFAIMALDFAGKFTGCALSTRLLGFSWREATAVGALMSCKGMLGIIILNVGLSAGILTPQVFSMFVFAALILAFMSTPLVNFIYPPDRRTLASVTGIASVPSTNDFEKAQCTSETSEVVVETSWRSRYTVVLDEFNHMPGIIALTKLVPSPSLEDSAFATAKPAPSVNALHLIELSERPSMLMKSTMTETLIDSDPLTGIFKMFGEQNGIQASASLSVVPQEEWAETVAEHAQRHSSQLVLISWTPPPLDPTVDPSDTWLSHPHGSRSELGTLDTLLGLSCDASASTLRSQFVRGVFQHSKTDVALFVDLGRNKGMNGQQHILLPFFCGPDDRLALELVVQLCANPRTSATVIRVGKSAQAVLVGSESAVADKNTEVSPTFVSSGGETSTTYPSQSPTTADDVMWSRYASPSVNTETHTPLHSALSRMTFTHLSDPLPLHALLQRAKQLDEIHSRVLIVVGRSTQPFQECLGQELRQILGAEQEPARHEMARNTIGEVGTAFVMSAGKQSGVIVVQAARESVATAEV